MHFVYQNDTSLRHSGLTRVYIHFYIYFFIYIDYHNSMKLGPFYFDTKEIFLLLAAVFVGLAIYFHWPLWEFEGRELLTLIIIFLLTKGLLPSTHNEVFLLHALVTVGLTIFVPFFQVLLFYSISFAFFKAIKVL